MPPLSSFLLTLPQSYTLLPRVTDLPLLSATSTKAPDVTEDDSSVYTASSSSSSFSVSSSSSFYATSSSSSTSDKVSQLDSLNILAVTCLSGNFLAFFIFVLQFTCWSEPCTDFALRSAIFSLCTLCPLVLFLVPSDSLPKIGCFWTFFVKLNHPTFLACSEVQK